MKKKGAGCLIKGRLARNLNHKKKRKSKQLHSVAAFYNLKWISDWISLFSISSIDSCATSFIRPTNLN